MATPDLVALVKVAGRPVPVDIAARALNASAEDIMALGAQLVASGELVESTAGYSAVAGTDHEPSPAVRAFMASHLADALTEAHGDKAEIGRLLFTAGRFADSWRALADASLDASALRTDHDKVELLEQARRALAEAHIDGGLAEARVLLALARLYRARGDSLPARDAVEQAQRKLEGDELIDALGFAASIADDLQHPQDAERWVALGELAAANQGALAKLGSLLTFHGRELSRLGFAQEAQAAIEKGNGLLATVGSRQQRYYGHINEAWVELDHGEMRLAEASFDILREQARELEGEASQADKEAYWARATFGTGRPDLALGAVERASALAEAAHAFAPKFIAQLALAEGGLLYERWDVALEAADRALATALEHLPAWENVCRNLKARALFGSGAAGEARAEAELALAATPAGANGRRLRLRLEELELELADTWDRRRAEDVSDQLLQSRWLGSAVDLMTSRASRDNDREVAAEAAALAMQIGNPMQAAKAIRAGNLWKDPLARPVLAALQSLQRHCPPDWYPAFLAESPAAEAIAAASEVDEEDLALLRDKIAEALGSAGLVGDTILSPAQRRAAGLVHRRPRRRLSPLALIAAIVAMVVVAVGAALAVVNLTAPDPVAAPVTTAQRTTTTVPPIEERVIAAPNTGLLGTADFRGGPGRSGFATGGFTDLEGAYWRQRPGGSLVVGTSAVAWGRYLFIATDENRVYGLEQTGGRVNVVIPTDSAVTATPALGQPGGEDNDPVVVFPTADGVVHGYSALRNGAAFWTYETGSQVRAPALVVDQTIFVATQNGYIHGLSIGGEPLWRYPLEEGSELSFQTAPALHNGIVYATSREGTLHLIDAATGTPVCDNPIELVGEVVTHPAIAGDVVFVGVELGGIHAYAAGSCGLEAEGYSSFYPSSRAVRLSPAVTPEVLYLLEDRLLLAMALDSALWVDAAGGTPSPWSGPFAADDLITTPPVATESAVYLGSQDGVVHALDAADGTSLWKFDAGAPIRGEPIVVPGAVFITTADGEIIAAAGK